MATLRTRSWLYPQDDDLSLHDAAVSAAAAQAPATFTLANSAPIVNGETVTLRGSTPVSAHESVLLANDSDADGDALRISAYTQPSHGTLTRSADGTLTYTPDAGYIGPDSFGYQVIDAQGAFSNGTVSFNILPPDVMPNQPPVVNDEFATVQAGTSVSAHESVLLGNDVDPEGGALSILSYTQPANGTLARAADGTLTYTPRAGFSGIDTFTYTVADAQGATDVGSVTLTVLPGVVPAPPRVSIAEDRNDDGSLTRAELAGSTRVDVQVDLPAGAAPGDQLLLRDTLGNSVSRSLSAADLIAGQILFDDAFPLPAPGATLTVSATITNAAGTVSPTASDSAVYDANFTPTAVDDANTVQLGAGFPQVSGNVLTNDTDPDGPTAALQVAGVATTAAVAPGLGVGQVIEGQYGHLSINPAGGYTYVADKVAGVTAPVQDTFYYLNKDAGNAVSAAPARLTFQIDPSLANVLTVSSPQVTEGGDLVFNVATSAAAAPTTLTLALSGGSATLGVDTTGPVQVNLGNGWQNLVGDTVLLPANTTSLQLRVPTVNDSVLELNETLLLRATSANGSTASGTGTLVDNDLTSQVSGLEDTPLVLSWAQFNLQVPLGAQPQLVIESLPADGRLQLNVAGVWTAVATGQQISKADVDAGRLRFLPDANEAGSNAYNAPGVGNKLNDYASFNYGANDGNGVGYSRGVMTVDIAPKVDGGQTATMVVLDSEIGDEPPGIPDDEVLAWSRVTFSISGSSPDTDGSERYRIGLSNLGNGDGIRPKVYSLAGVQIPPDAAGIVWVNPADQVYITSDDSLFYWGDYVLYRQELNAQGGVIEQTASASKHFSLISPLVMDLDGNGVQTVGADQGAYFDLDNDGVATQSGWVSPQDGLLVRDLDGNGSIDNGSELFGNHTALADGSNAPDGFAALAVLDDNHDGVVDAADAGFAALQVWRDANGDGSSQAGELLSLGSLGIVALNLAAVEGHTGQNGNLIGLVSSYVTADGGAHEMADVWFAANGNTRNDVAPELLHPADLLGSGAHPALDAWMGHTAPGSPAAASYSSTASPLPFEHALPAVRYDLLTEPAAML